MTVRIRMHPMYADFIKYDLGSDEKKRVFATERKPIGLLIKNFLRVQPQNPVKHDYDRNAYVEFLIPDYEDINTLHRNYISENSERIIASKIKNQFYYELHAFIVEMHGSGIKEIRRAIILFCEEFGIQDSSYKVNSLEKEYRRWRERLNIVKKTREIASSLTAFFSLVSPLIVLFA